MADDADRDVVPDTAARIRETALRLFSQQGYEKTSLRQIAEELSITKAAVYYHYRSKIDILDDLLRPIADEEERIFEEIDETMLRTAEGRLQLVERYLDLVLRHRALTAYVMSDLVGISNSRVFPRLRQNDRHAITLLTRIPISLEDRVRLWSAVGAVIMVLPLNDVPTAELRPLMMKTARDTLGL